MAPHPISEDTIFSVPPNNLICPGLGPFTRFSQAFWANMAPLGPRRCLLSYRLRQTRTPFGVLRIPGHFQEQLTQNLCDLLAGLYRS